MFCKSPWWRAARRWHSRHASGQLAVQESDAYSPSPLPNRKQSHFITHRARSPLYETSFPPPPMQQVHFPSVRSIKSYLIMYASYLSEVTPLNENCFGERNHVATLTLVCGEVRNTNLSLKGQKQEWVKMMLYTVGSISLTDVIFCIYLCIRRQISDGHFEGFQDSHGPRCSVIKHIPHTWLQQVGLRRRLGNSHTHLREKSEVEQIKNLFCPNVCANPLNRIQCVFSLTRAQKLLMASGENPRLLRAVRVKRRGSSQSLQKRPNDKWADYTTRVTFDFFLQAFVMAQIIKVQMGHRGNNRCHSVDDPKCGILAYE